MPAFPNACKQAQQGDPVLEFSELAEGTSNILFILYGTGAKSAQRAISTIVLYQTK